ASAPKCLPSHLENLPTQKIHVIGAGKAAAAMAKTIENHVAGETSGLVVTRYGHAVSTSSIEVVEAAHPVPDELGLRAAMRVIDLAKTLDEMDYVIIAISGGASSLLSRPHPEIAFEDKQSITRQLLLAGATIHEINCVRKHLSAIKGGRLMSHIFPASALTLCISDVVGDNPSIIGSGPTVGDPSTCDEVLDVISQYRINVPQYILTKLNNGELETPKPENSVFEQSRIRIVARPQDALKASAVKATKLGLEVFSLGDAVEGDTNQVAKQHAAFVREKLTHFSTDKPFVILSGGETTVNVTGSGKGGPNSQYVLATAKELDGMTGVYAIACDTDGIDGSEDNAGALMTPSTLKRARSKGMDVNQYLKNNDAYSFFENLGDLVMTGPTLTNVNDFRAIAYLPGLD
ncbi:MAG: glycerate kinase, partial [Gammaproteobacteria bacterium]|nr:glycerate kinase [Gammaproteobacteria bacterium]